MPSFSKVEAVALLAQGQRHAIGAAVAGAAAFDIGAVAPFAVGQAAQLVQERGLAVPEDALHHALHHARAIARDELLDAGAGRRVAGHLGAEVERHQLGLARGAEIELLDVAADFAVLDDFHGRDQDALVVGALGRGAEAAGRDAADIVLMQAVRHPAEQFALVEDGADQHHVLLMRRADPGIVGEEHIAGADAGIVGAVLEDPLHLRIGDAGHVLHVGAEIDELGILGEDRGVEVERVHGDGRARDALDRGAVLLVHVPQIVADDLEGDRVEFVGRIAVQAQLWRDGEALRRHVGMLHAVEHHAGHVAELGHGAILSPGGPPCLKNAHHFAPQGMIGTVLIALAGEPLMSLELIAT